MLRMLRNELYKARKDEKIALMATYYGTAKRLSEQSASLQGRSVLSWRIALEELAKEILKDKNLKTVIRYGTMGKLPGVNAPLENDFIATVLDVGERDKPDANDLWTLNEPWILGEQKVPVQMLPGAWSVGSAMKPITCLVFGRLVAIDSSNAKSSTSERGALKLQVHAALPQ